MEGVVGGADRGAAPISAEPFSGTAQTWIATRGRCGAADVNWVPRDQRAMSIASRTSVVRICAATRQPTIILEQASVLKRT